MLARVRRVRRFSLRFVTSESSWVGSVNLPAGMAEIVKTDAPDARVFKRGSPRALHELDLLTVIAEYGALAPAGFPRST